MTNFIIILNKKTSTKNDAIRIINNLGPSVIGITAVNKVITPKSISPLEIS